MTVKRPIALAAACLLGLTLAACSSTKIVESHVDKSLFGRDLEGVLVVAVTKGDSARRDFEAAFAKAINSRGARAVASFELVPYKKPSPEMLIAAAKKAGLDTILVTRYLGEKRDEVFHPGRIYYGIAPGYGGSYTGGFGGYYGYAYEIAREQPVWTANVTHTLVSDLYIRETQAHVWQAVSETVESSGDTKMRNDAIRALTGDLKVQGLLP